MFSAYLDEMLPARDAGRVAGHLARCQACREELAGLERAMTVLDHVRPATPPIDLWERLQERLAEQAREAKEATPAANRPGRGRRTALSPWPGAFRLAFVPAVAAVALGVGVMGYRLGLQGDAGDPGVLAGALISRPPEQQVAARPSGRTAAESTSASGALAPIVPPEATFGSWEAGEAPDARERAGTRPAGEDDALVVEPAAEGAPVPPTLEPPGRLAVKPRGARAEDIVLGPATPAAEIATATVGGDAGFERLEATASLPVADALQASVEEVARRQISDEVALLAQALKRAETRPDEEARPSGSRESQE